MIKAVFFDLDGTLVNTEELKSRTYQQALEEIGRKKIGYEEVDAAYAVVVGQPRQEVAAFMMDRFQIDGREAGTQDRLIQAYVDRYEKLLEDIELVQQNVLPCTVELLHMVRQKGCLTALASMSPHMQVERIIESIHLKDQFDLVLSRDMVSLPKPDPEVYILGAQLLSSQVSECLVIEDSPAGVQAALNAGMACIALANLLTQQALKQMPQLPREWLVEDPETLIAKASSFFE